MSQQPSAGIRHPVAYFPSADLPPAPRVLSFARPGMFVQVENIGAIIVLSRCDAESHFYCVSCQTALANLGQLEMHVERGGKHELIRWCRKHGCPEGPTSRDVASIARFQQLESGL